MSFLRGTAENMGHVLCGSPDRSDYATAHYVATDTGQMLKIFPVFGNARMAGERVRLTNAATVFALLECVWA